ncbi:MAG: hypothetical protein ISS35_06935 [Kiritimatiellae bacterium]|nr:hypothetical protein [Kiritimatiellia bacterium]
MTRLFYCLVLATISACLPLSHAPAQEVSENAARTYVIPIDGMIERGLLYVLRRSFSKAKTEGADTIILHMNTPGGKVNVTEDIIRMLIALPENITTYTFIDKDALSAGSLIALATRHIYMSPGSRIGASAIVTPFGDIEEGDMKEKHLSSLIALVRSATERNHHDPALAEAMIRRSEEYKIGDEILCEEGELLTLTELQAEKIIGEGEDARPLLSAGTVTTLDELLEKIGQSDRTIVRIESTWSEEVARWIELFGILFLIGGILGLYIEFKIPGFGLPGITGILCLGVFFWGHHVAGLAGMEELIIFFVGLTLLAIEIFVIPGFGITGISGIALIMTALTMAMVQHYPGTPWFEAPTGDLQSAVIRMSIALMTSFLAMVLLARILPETHSFRRLMLTKSVGRDEGYQASHNEPELVGKAGFAETDLHPSGIALVENKRLSVVAQGAYISKGTSIVIAEAHGNRIVVTESSGAAGQETA